MDEKENSTNESVQEDGASVQGTAGRSDQGSSDNPGQGSSGRSVEGSSSRSSELCDLFVLQHLSSDPKFSKTAEAFKKARNLGSQVTTQFVKSFSNIGTLTLVT